MAKITEGHTAVSTSIFESKEVVAGKLLSGKESLYSNISVGSEAVANSRAGVLVGEMKQAVTMHIVNGKEALGNGVTAGRDAVCSHIQGGAKNLSNTRAGAMVGAGVDQTLAATECWVEYFIPEIENEKELFSNLEKEERIVGLPLTRQPKEKVVVDEGSAQGEEELDETLKKCEVSRVDRVYMISRKMKLRMYYRAMQRLQNMQQSSKATLVQLKEAIDLVSRHYQLSNDLFL